MSNGRSGKISSTWATMRSHVHPITNHLGKCGVLLPSGAGIEAQDPLAKLRQLWVSGLAVVLDGLAKLGHVGGTQGEVPLLAIGSGQLAASLGWPGSGSAVSVDLWLTPHTPTG